MSTDFETEITRINKVRLTWTPRHSGVTVNETLNFLARQSIETPFIRPESETFT